MKLCPPLIFDTSKVLDGTVIVFIPFLHQALLNADHTYKLFQIFQSMKNIRIRFVRSITNVYYNFSSSQSLHLLSF